MGSYKRGVQDVTVRCRDCRGCRCVDSVPRKQLGRLLCWSHPLPLRRKHTSIPSGSYSRVSVDTPLYLIASASLPDRALTRHSQHFSRAEPMPITTYILDHRSHKTRHSEGSNSINSVAALSPISNGTTAVDPELESFEQRPIINNSVDQVRAWQHHAEQRPLHSFNIQLEALNGQLKVENRIREGAENLLQMPLAVRVVTISPNFI